MNKQKVLFIILSLVLYGCNDSSNLEEKTVSNYDLNEVSPGILRTPDSNFEDLENYPFEPNYMMIDGIRIHYLDEGPEDANPIFLLHGLPTWSYLYRKMIPIFVEEGHRVIVPDMVGFGKSDKYMDKNEYSYIVHVHFMKELIHRLDLSNIVIMGQDWGGPIGMRVVAEMPEKFSAVVMSNGGLPAMPNPQAWFTRNIMNFFVWWNKPVSLEELIKELQKSSKIEEPSTFDRITTFSKWIAHSYYAEDLDIVAVMENLGGLKNMTESEKKAYEAPYPSSEYKAGANTFASFAVDELSNNEKYMKNIFENWNKPFLIAFGENERVTYSLKAELVDRIPNPIVAEDIKNAGHFIQEDAGPELAVLINEFIAENL